MTKQSSSADTGVLWYCPKCTAMNNDDKAKTTWPMCGECEHIFEWSEIQPAPSSDKLK